MIAPNLSERIAWYQERLRPEDSAMGNGIADWTITAEYRSGLKVDGADIWGCMCSPSKLPELQKLTADDIAAKRAHIVIRTPENADDLAEVERTLLHELGHVLVAPMQSTNREAEENAMHSFDHFFSKLSPEQGAILARAMQNPMARAYRAKETLDIVTTSLNNAQKGLALLKQLEANVRGATSPQLVAYVIAQLSQIIQQKILHGETEVAQAREQQNKITDSMQNLLDRTKEQWEADWCQASKWQATVVPTPTSYK
jgi:hypothetical protein